MVGAADVRSMKLRWLFFDDANDVIGATSGCHRAAGFAAHARASVPLRALMTMRLLLLTLLFLPLIGVAETLRLKGSNTVGERLLPALAAAFLQSKGCASTTVKSIATDHVTVVGDAACSALSVDIEAFGTATGFAALSDEQADLAMASRPIRPSELQALPALADPKLEQVLALDGLAIIVAPDSPLSALSLSDVRALFSGALDSMRTLGGPVGPINRYVRDDRSGTFDTFQQLVLGSQSLATARTFRFESSTQLADAVARDPNGIGFVSLAAIGRAKALKIAGGTSIALAPTSFSVATEDYLLARRLYLYHLPTPSALTQAFIAFTRSPIAAQLTEREQFVAPSVRAYAQATAPEAPADYRALTTGLERLSLNFRFADGMSLLDSKSLIDLKRLADWHRAQSSTPKLTLIGFSDATEALPYLSLSLSTDRADYVAERLGDLNIAVQRARGLGAAAPLIASADPLARQKNRRVEVWVERASRGAAAGAD